MCAAAPSLRVFFRRYLGGSFASRAYKSTRGETPGLPKSTQGTAFGSVDQNDKSITVIRSTSVTFDQDGPNDKKGFTESLDTIGETESQDRSWSPTPSKERLTSYSHEEGPIAMRNLAWSNPEHSSAQSQAAPQRPGAWT